MIAVIVLPAAADNDFTKPEELVTRAKGTFEDFVSDPNMDWFRNNLKFAKAVMIIPRIIKGGFFIGGSGGNGVLSALDSKTGDWSNPAFYTMGSVSFGLQIGGAADQVLLLVMTDKAMESYLSGSLRITL
jgi:lipid-binding SYLF domain-containing protein